VSGLASVCVFCGSQDAPTRPTAAPPRRPARRARRGLRVVTGGGRVGLLAGFDRA
jgi:predicted Rossmann-fold nucleotide-binding protein